MKITAEGWSKSRVGTHTILESKPDDICIGADGRVRIISRSKELALNGQFRVQCEFSEDDMAVLMMAAVRAPLEQKLYDLEKTVKALTKRIHELEAG
jgi:hypothetical protein